MIEKLSLGLDKPLPPRLPDPEEYTVDFDGENDPIHPYNWTRSNNCLASDWKIDTEDRLFTSILVCSGTWIVSFTSAIFAPGIDSASEEFDVSNEVGTLGTTLYVLGFASGPMIWAPLSELRGRKWPLTIAMLLGGIFTIASAVAKDIQTLIICRFFAGVCGASQFTVVPGVLADIFDNTYRGVAISVYALTVFGGPFIAPFTGGFIASSYLGWRWTLYIPAFLSFANGAVSLFYLRESYAPCLLIAKAASLRRQTGNWGIHARVERNEIDPRAMVEKYFTRPLKMLVTEPILLLVSLYMSFIYGLVYCLLEAYPVVFEGIYGMKPGISGLPFIGLFLGVFLAISFILSQHASYVRQLEENKGVPVPEWRLKPTLLGAPIFAIGIFW
ncbi:hypothetical protein N0V82_005693 [Gnomoniopsis sp. IMI 355080]|nr:hypothetical protein N0V82_005693 [Gnomoniopsis sp. IMI 355080]